jgi:hypothetical protein
LTAGPPGGLISLWSRNLGDGAHITSQVTRATKIYPFATACLRRSIPAAWLDAPLAFFFRTLKLDVFAMFAVCDEREVSPSTPQESEPQELREEEPVELERQASNDEQDGAARVAEDAQPAQEVMIKPGPTGEQSTCWTGWTRRVRCTGTVSIPPIIAAGGLPSSLARIRMRSGFSAPTWK